MIRNELTDELVTQAIDQGTGVQHVDVFQALYTLNDDGSRATETDTRYTPGATVIDNKTKLTWTYDDDGRLIEEQLTTLAGTDGPTPYDDQFGYDLDNSSGLTNRLWFVRAAIRTRRRENPPYRRLDRRW